MEITGQLLHLRLYNNDTWGRGEMRLSSGKKMTVTGECLVGVKAHKNYIMRGETRKHPKYGEQLEVVAVLQDVPQDSFGLAHFLHKNFDGCGPVTAKHIVDWYMTHASLGDLKSILVNKPWSLELSPSCLHKKIKYVAPDGMTEEEHIYRYMGAHLGGAVPDNVLRRLSKFLLKKIAEKTDVRNPTQECWDAYVENPYAAIRSVDGYGFRNADKAGQILGIPHDSPLRMGALVYHVLTDDREGNAYLPRHVFIDKVKKFEPVMDPLIFDQYISAGIQHGFPIHVDGDRYYDAKLYKAEASIAHILANMMAPCHPLYSGDGMDLDRDISVHERIVAHHSKSSFKTLDSSQRQALANILTSTVRLHTITAGPGCGKTAIMEVFANLAGAMGYKLKFCAPTGKAAKVLNQRIGKYGYSAQTIHSLLEPEMVSARGFSFKRHKQNPLDAHIVIVDESSMVDLEIFHALTQALPYGSRLILLGDADQLPSVGPGNILEDVMALPASHNRLTVTHRNDGGILRVVNSIREGHFDHNWNFSDVELLGNPGDAELNFVQVVNQYVKAVKKVGIQRTALLIPNRGDVSKRKIPGWNINYANYVLQGVMNPLGEEIKSTYFRVKDRIIIRKNQTFEMGVDDQGQKIISMVVNGDTGTIDSVVRVKKDVFIRVHLDDGRYFLFDVNDSDCMDLAYAGTVHSAQGSEYDIVICVIPSFGSMDFLTRKILYTATSRSKSHLILLGEDNQLKKVAARPGKPRFSWLKQRVALAMK